MHALCGCAAALLLALGAGPDATGPGGPAVDPRRSDVATLRVGTPEPPTTEVAPGDPAPDFSYQGHDGRWRHLHDLTEQGPVLLIFGADESRLRQLERDRQRLLDLGVIPVAVVDATSRKASSLVQRAKLNYTVLADPRRVIAAQFNAVETSGQRALPSWFVVDRSRTVRGLSRDRLPADGFVPVAAKSLALPLDDGVVPTGR